MKLTRRGRIVALVTLFIFVITLAWITAPYNIDYYSGDFPRIVDTREGTPNG